MYEQLAPLTWLAGAKLPELPLLAGLGLEVWLGAQSLQVWKSNAPNSPLENVGFGMVM